MKRILGTAVAALTVAAIVAGCSTSNPDTSATTGNTSSPPASVTGDITVFAAASLKSTFTALGTQLEKDDPGAHVTFSFAGAMRAGIDAACREGVVAITAGNYGGKLGPHHFHLRKIMSGETA